MCFQGINYHEVGRNDNRLRLFVLIAAFRTLTGAGTSGAVSLNEEPVREAVHDDSV